MNFGKYGFFFLVVVVFVGGLLDATVLNGQLSAMVQSGLGFIGL